LKIQALATSRIRRHHHRGRRKRAPGLFTSLLGAALLLGSPLPVQHVGVALAQDSDGGADSAAAADPDAVAAAAVMPSVYWGAMTLGWPADTHVLDAFEQAAGKRMSLVGWGQPWWHNGGYQPFQTAYFQTVRDRGAIPVLSWGSWDYCCDVDQPEFKLSTITAGDHDEFLIKWARSAKAWGHPFFLTFDSEMNGWWWPWTEQTNGNQPGDFVAAWRHVVDIFRQEGVKNVTWVWCPNVVGPQSTPMETLYPGDDYVDWTCMDGYNWGAAKGNTWQDIRQVFRGNPTYKTSDTYALLQQVAPSKPMMIGETASTESGGSKPAWISDAYSDLLPKYFPAVKAVVWFGRNDEDLSVNWRVDSSPESQAAFAAGIASPRYVANAYRNLATSPIPAAEDMAAAAVNP
jgi:mannan endo-1,4-beta-mannosidase